MKISVTFYMTKEDSSPENMDVLGWIPWKWTLSREWRSETGHCISGQVTWLNPVKTSGRWYKMCLRNVLAERQGRWDTSPFISIHHWLGLLQGWKFLSVYDLLSSQPSMPTASCNSQTKSPGCWHHEAIGILWNGVK